MNTKKLAIIFSLTTLLLLGIVGIKFSNIGQRGDGVLGTAEAAQTTIIDTSTLSSVTTGLQRKLVQTSQNVLVLFYFDGSAIASKKSVNQGNTWTKWDGSDGKEIIVTNSNIGSNFSVTIDSNDNIYLAYCIPNDLYFRKLTYDSQKDTWSIGEPINVDGGGYVERDGPGIAKDSKGRIWVSFKDYSGVYGRGLKVTYSDDEGGTWSIPELLMSSTGGTLQPSTLILKDNYPACVYAVNGYTLKWRRWNGTTWSQEETIYTPSQELYSNFSAAVTSNGYIHLLFGESKKIKYTYFNNSQWSTPIILNTVDSLYPSLTTDGLNLFAFWSQYVQENQYNIVYQRFNGASWGNTNFITSDNQNNLYPSTMLVSTDYVPVVWTEGTSPYNIKFSKISFGSSPGSPSLMFPSTGETNINLTPLFQLSAVDADNSSLRYKIELALDSALTQNSQTFDQTQEIQGWNKSLYTSGETATYTLQISLAPHTIYYWRAYAIDPEDTNRWSQASEVWSFTTGADTTPPIISDEEAIDISENAATIIWTTDEPATSQVEYGTTTDYGMLSPEDAAPTTSHFVNLSGLYSSTIYHFRIRSKDETSNEANSKDYTFKTAHHVRANHPRLYITSETLPTLRERAASTHSEEYQTLLNIADSYFDANINSYDGLTFYYDVVTYGLLYQLGEIPGMTYMHTPEQYGNRAAVLVEAMADKILANPNADEAWSSYGVYTYGLSIGYDWANNLLTTEAKSKIMNAVIYIRNNTALEDRGNFLGIVQRSVPIGGLAFLGDGINDSKAQEYVDLFKPLWIDGILASNEMISNGDGGYDEGYRYSKIELNYTAKMLDAWRTATGENLFSSSTWLRNYTYWLVYICKARPDKDGLWQSLRIADDALTTFGALDHMPGRATVGLLASVYNQLGDTDLAGLATWFIQNRMDDDWPARRHTAWSIIWYDKTILPKSPSQLNLPLTRKFSGIGEVIMRTGFESENDTVVAFLAQPYWYSGHTQFHQNSFIIEKNGELALDSGQYESDNSDHEWEYSERTIAHNTITIYNPVETFSPRKTNDGGQRTLDSSPEQVSQITPQSKYDFGGIVKLEIVPNEYDYIVSDATRAYNSTLYTSNGNDAKISNFTRQFIYLRPEITDGSDIFVVFDRVNSTNASFVKTWLLHMPFEPTINGNDWSDPVYPWHTVYDGNLVEFNSTTNQSKLFSKTLLPEAHRIVKIGGPGHEFEDANGTNWPLKFSNYEDWMGAWRIEVQPTEAKTDDLFLHVLYATDISTAEMSVAVRVDGDTMVGAYIQDETQGYKVAMFSKTEYNQNQVTYTLPETQAQIKHLIADLATGFTYNIYQDGKKIDEKQPSPAGTLYFTSQGASVFQITKGEYVAKPNITLTKSADVATVQSGDIIIYTIAYQNIGTGEATKVVITDPIPQGTIYETGSAKFTSGSGIVDDNGPIISWTIASLPAGQGGEAEFRVRVE